MKICQSKVLSEERKEMVGNFPSKNFLGGNFPRGGEGLSTGEFDGWELFGWEFPRGEFSS